MIANAVAIARRRRLENGSEDLHENGRGVCGDGNGLEKIGHKSFGRNEKIVQFFDVAET